MSHQDSGNDLTCRESLEVVFAKLLPNALNMIACHGNSTLKPYSLAAMAIACFGWTSASTTLSERFRLAGDALKRVIGCRQNGSRQGIMKALSRYGEQLIGLVVDNLASQVPELKGSWTSQGKVNFAVDGTKFLAPRSKANQERFSPASSTRTRAKSYRTIADESKALTVQVLVTVIWHIGSGLPYRWRASRSTGSERGDLKAMLDALPSNARLIGDAAYIGYPLWNAIVQSKRTFIVRVGSNVSLLKNLSGRWRFADGYVHYWPHQAMIRKQPPLLLRLITLKTPKQKIHLVTNELDIDDKLVCELYQQRWGIEVFFRSIKQSLQRRKLCCQTPTNLITEINWTLIGSWAALFTAKQALHEDKVEPSMISPVRVFRAFADTITMIAYQAKREKRLFHLLKRAIKTDESNRTTSKASRKYPRKKAVPICGPPTIRSPNKMQREAMKKLTI